MRKESLIILIVAAILGLILIGFIIGSFASIPSVSCSTLACSCTGQNSEIFCNRCYQPRGLFNLGIIKVLKTCEKTQYTICDNGIQTGTRLGPFENCSLNWHFFGLDSSPASARKTNEKLTS